VQHEERAPEEPEQSKIFLYLGGAVLVGLAIWGFKGFQAAEEYFAGYLLEQSLSVDNLFVFLLCFNFFKTPPDLQSRVLNVGIWSAAVLRLVMILAGVELVSNFKPLLLVFSAILLYSSYGLFFAEDDDEEEDLSQNFIVKTINRVRRECMLILAFGYMLMLAFGCSLGASGMHRPSCSVTAQPSRCCIHAN
jgi:Integral membrane protein TerC family